MDIIRRYNVIRKEENKGQLAVSVQQTRGQNISTNNNKTCRTYPPPSTFATFPFSAAYTQPLGDPASSLMQTQLYPQQQYHPHFVSMFPTPQPNLPISADNEMHYAQNPYVEMQSYPVVARNYARASSSTQFFPSSMPTATSPQYVPAHIHQPPHSNAASAMQATHAQRVSMRLNIDKQYKTANPKEERFSGKFDDNWSLHRKTS